MVQRFGNSWVSHGGSAPSLEGQSAKGYKSRCITRRGLSQVTREHLPPLSLAQELSLCAHQEVKGQEGEAAGAKGESLGVNGQPDEVGTSPQIHQGWACLPHGSLPSGQLPRGAC